MELWKYILTDGWAYIGTLFFIITLLLTIGFIVHQCCSIITKNNHRELVQETVDVVLDILTEQSKEEINEKQKDFIG